MVNFCSFSCDYLSPRFDADCLQCSLPAIFSFETVSFGCVLWYSPALSHPASSEIFKLFLEFLGLQFIIYTKRFLNTDYHFLPPPGGFHGPIFSLSTERKRNIGVCSPIDTSVDSCKVSGHPIEAHWPRDQKKGTNFVIPDKRIFRLFKQIPSPYWFSFQSFWLSHPLH